MKKGGAAAEKTADGAEEEGRVPASRKEGREPGKGKGKGSREREPRARRDKESAEGGAEESAEARGRGRGRGKGGRRGPPAEGTADEKGYTSTEDTADEVRSGAALLSMLKANPPKVTRYTKGELLSIARLPASNVKPPDLSPLIDKENKDSHLLIRMAGGRQDQGDGEDGPAEAAAAKRERKERRAERRGAERAGSEDGDGPVEAPPPRRGARDTAQAASVAPVAPPTPAGASTPSSPNRGRHAGGPSSEKPAGSGKGAATTSEEVEAPKASRAFEKWFEPKGDATPASQAATPSAAGTRGFPASLLQQQAPSPAALGQAQQMIQAAAYMQAMSMNAAAAAAAGRGGYGAGLPWGYNPYLFPYANPYGAYPPAAAMDYGPGAAQQAKLAAAQAAVNTATAAGLPGGAGLAGLGGAFGAGSGLAQSLRPDAKALAKQQATAASPPQRPTAAGAAAKPFDGAAAAAAAAAASGEVAKGGGKDDGEGEDEAGCAQS